VFFRRCSFFGLDPSFYPYFDLYPAPYGSRRMLDPSPGKKQNDDRQSLSPVLRTGYPSFRLCMYLCLLLHIGLLELHHLSRQICLSKLRPLSRERCQRDSTRRC
jgi:hypothetical protein